MLVCYTHTLGTSCIIAMNPSLLTNPLPAVLLEFVLFRKRKKRNSALSRMISIGSRFGCCHGDTIHLYILFMLLVVTDCTSHKSGEPQVTHLQSPSYKNDVRIRSVSVT